MKAKIIIIVFFSLCVFASAIGEEWEGTVAMAQYGEFPANGFYGASNAFPRNTIVEVKNSKNGKTVTLIIISRLEQEGLFMLVSREAAQGLGFNADEIIRADIKIISGSGEQLGLASKDLPVSPDPDINPAASAADVEDSIYLRAIRNLRDRYALSTSKYQPEDQTVQDKTPDKIPDKTNDRFVDNTVKDTNDTDIQNNTKDNRPPDTVIVDDTHRDAGKSQTDLTVQHVPEEHGDNTPEVLNVESTGPGTSGQDLVAVEPPLPDDYPEINTGFVKAGSDDHDALVALNPDEPQYKSEEKVVETVPDRVVPEDFGPEPRYNDLAANPSAQGREGLNQLVMSAPETAEDELYMADIFANPEARHYDFADAAVAFPETDDDLVFSDAFASPGTYTYDFAAGTLDIPQDPSEAGREFMVDDSSAVPPLHDNRNFDNLAYASPLMNDEDRAVYDSLFVRTPKEEKYHATGQTPPDPFALTGADTLAAAPQTAKTDLLVQHSPELEGLESPKTVDSLAAVPGIKAAPLLAVEMEPETPEGLSRDALTYDTMLAKPSKDDTEFSSGPEPEVPGTDTVSAENMTYVMRDSDDTFDAPLSDLPTEPGQEVETVEDAGKDVDTVQDKVPDKIEQVPDSYATSVMLVPSDRISGNNVSGPVPEKEAARTAAFSEAGEIKKGNEYLQLAVYTDQGSVKKVYDEYAEMFPITVLVSSTTTGKNYKVLIGPLGPDESGALLYNFKRRGYRDAFLRSGQD
ncbi:MAG: hypothetical protein JW874_16270 [Spirochaetales bacterium]|nr:hypothetical protein [Spirochaetales bacterium]